MNLARGGRRRSSGESSVYTLQLSSAGNGTSSIWLNLECRANESLPDTMWLITIILGGAPQKFEIRNSKSERNIAYRKITFLLRRDLFQKRIFRDSSEPTRNTGKGPKSQATRRGISCCWVMARCGKLSTLNFQLSTCRHTCIFPVSNSTTSCQFTMPWQRLSFMQARLSNGDWL